MSKQSRIVVGIFAVWTLFVWINRVRNIANDAGLDSGAAGFRYAIAATMIAPALWLLFLVLVWSQFRRIVRLSLLPFVVWTVIIWLWRSIEIIVDWRSFGFVLVHLMLAVVSVMLGLWARTTVRPLSHEEA